MDGRTSAVEPACVSGEAAGGGGSATAKDCCQAWEDLSLSNRAFTPSGF